MDLSREAVRRAARSCRSATFAVADVWRLLPLRSGSVDVLLSVFAPRSRDQFDRVLRPDGLLLVPIPEPWHLRELRDLEGFLGIQEDKREVLGQQLAPAFGHMDEQAVEYEMELAPEDLSHLVRMTPSCRHLGEESLKALAGSAGARVTAAFRVPAFGR